MIHQHFETIQLERELLQRRPEAFRCVHPALARRPPGCAGSSLEHDDKCSVLMVLICLVVVVVVLVVAVVVLFLVAIPIIPQCLVVVVVKRRRRLVFVCPCLCASAGRPIFFGAASRSFRGFSLWLSVCLCPNSYPACSSRSWLGLQTRAQPRTNSKTGLVKHEQQKPWWIYYGLQITCRFFRTKRVRRLPNRNDAVPFSLFSLVSQ